jgi:hypothetical protein
MPRTLEKRSTARRCTPPSLSSDQIDLRRLMVIFNTRPGSEGEGEDRVLTRAKKEGLILSYRVLTTEGHDQTDWNMLLMTEYKDLATMEANQQKGDAFFQKAVGDDQKQMQGYKDRLEIREVLGTRLAREIVLEPQTASSR